MCPGRVVSLVSQCRRRRGARVIERRCCISWRATTTTTPQAPRTPAEGISEFAEDTVVLPSRYALTSMRSVTRGTTISSTTAARRPRLAAPRRDALRYRADRGRSSTRACLLTCAPWPERRSRRPRRSMPPRCSRPPRSAKVGTGSGDVVLLRTGSNDRCSRGGDYDGRSRASISPLPDGSRSAMSPPWATDNYAVEVLPSHPARCSSRCTNRDPRSRHSAHGRFDPRGARRRRCGRVLFVAQPLPIVGRNRKPDRADRRAVRPACRS